MPLCIMRFGPDYRWLYTDKYCHQCSSYTVGKTRREQQERSSIPPPAMGLSLKQDWTEQYHGQEVTGSFLGLIWWEDGFLKHFCDGGSVHKIWCWDINGFVCTFISNIISFYLPSVKLNFQWKPLTGRITRSIWTNSVNSQDKIWKHLETVKSMDYVNLLFCNFSSLKSPEYTYSI